MIDDNFVIFKLDDHRYALPLFSIESILQAVEITRLPSAPENVLGAVNVHGQIVPVIDIRRRLNLPEREIDLKDRLIIVRTSERIVGMMADTDVNVTRIQAGDISEKMNSHHLIRGIFQNGEKTIHILDPGELT